MARWPPAPPPATWPAPPPTARARAATPAAALPAAAAAAVGSSWAGSLAHCVTRLPTDGSWAAGGWMADAAAGEGGAPPAWGAHREAQGPPLSGWGAPRAPSSSQGLPPRAPSQGPPAFPPQGPRAAGPWGASVASPLARQPRRPSPARRLHFGPGPSHFESALEPAGEPRWRSPEAAEPPWQPPQWQPQAQAQWQPPQAQTQWPPQAHAPQPPPRVSWQTDEAEALEGGAPATLAADDSSRPWAAFVAREVAAPAETDPALLMDELF